MSNPAFPPGSRYASTPTATWKAPGGREIVYLTRRFVPRTETLTLVREHIVIEGDRIDVVAAIHLGDPEQSWQLGDANNALDLADLTATPGRRLRITLPQGVPGMPHV